MIPACFRIDNACFMLLAQQVRLLMLHLYRVTSTQRNTTT